MEQPSRARCNKKKKKHQTRAKQAEHSPRVVVEECFFFLNEGNGRDRTVQLQRNPTSKGVGLVVAAESKQ